MSRILHGINQLATKGLAGPSTSASVGMRASDEAIFVATDLVAAAVSDLQRASAGLNAPRGLIGATFSLATTAWNSATGTEGGPSCKDAGAAFVQRDGRYPAQNLVERAMYKYYEAQRYVVDLPDIWAPHIQAPCGRRGSRYGGGNGALGITLRGNNRRTRRAGWAVQTTLEDMQDVLAQLQQACAQAQPRKAHPTQQGPAYDAAGVGAPPQPYPPMGPVFNSPHATGAGAPPQPYAPMAPAYDALVKGIPVDGYPVEGALLAGSPAIKAC